MRLTKSIPVLFMSVVVALTSCADKQEITRLMNIPVYQSKAELRSSTGVQAARELVNPGKIFFKDNRLFVTEIGEGVHIIDNTDPSNPVNISFLEIPGVMDVQMKNDYLYADSFMDLVVFDLSDVNNAQLVETAQDVFIYNLPMHDDRYPRADVDENLGVVVDWSVEMRTEEFEEFDTWNVWGEEVMMLDMSVQSDASFATTSFEGASKSSGGNTFGKAGSMSRFMVKGNHLYVLDAWKLITLDIQDASSPEVKSEVVTPYFSETIFPIRNHLVLGTQNGIVFYGLDDMNTPEYISEYQHVTSCDPVFVSGDYAYVTLRSGNTCWGWVNELHVVNIADIASPYQERIYPMVSPRGLSVDGEHLFLCDGSAGLKIFDIDNNVELNMTNNYTNFQANDVITYGDVLMMIGEDGLVQYDYSDLDNIQQLSVIQTAE